MDYIARLLLHIKFPIDLVSAQHWFQDQSASCGSRVLGLAFMHSGIAQSQQRLGIPDLGHMLGGQRKRDGALNIGSNWLECYTTGMFALPSPMSHVTNAAFAQALLRYGTGLLTLMIHLIRNRQLLTRGLQRLPPPS